MMGQGCASIYNPTLLHKTERKLNTCLRITLYRMYFNVFSVNLKENKRNLEIPRTYIYAMRLLDYRAVG